MKLELTYPDPNKSFDFTELPSLPNKYKEDSGYLLIAMIRSTLNNSTVDRYVCFTNQDRTEVWLEKLAVTRLRRWFAIDDTVRIDDEEFNEVYSFLKKEKVL